MPYIANLICSEGAEHNELGLVLKQPITRVFLTNFPNNYTFFVSFSIVNVDRDIQENDYVSIYLFNDQMESIFETDKLPIPLPEDNEESLDNFTASLLLSNVQFKNEGLYQVRVDSNLADSSSTYFTVSS
ncbi:hypothetical protein [Enterococcus sp. AZ136]|uniref:hypothetical protein n=1 Tax=Enterococcus sp. AZ136 TaxID=2774788 RepID=UPI003D2AAA62